MSAPIFISYSSKDRVIAETICQALEARGQKCWIASRDVAAGENFQEAIVRALRSARVMLLVFTSNANNSDEIKKEIVLAGRNHVTVVPVRAEDVAPNDALAYEFATRQWIDLFKDWESEIERLISQVSGIVGAAPGQDDAVAPARPIRSPFARRGLNRMFVSLTVLAVLLLAGGGYLYTRLAVPTASPSPTPSQQDADETAWQNAMTAGTAAAFNEYLRLFPHGAHAEEAQLRVADLTAAGPTRNFDGTWLTTISCPSAAGMLGYSYQVAAQVNDGDYHGQIGKEGQASSLTIDGKVQADGSITLFVKGFVGSSAAAGNLPVGSPYFYHIAGHLDASSGTGHRVDGRPCDLTFAKQ